MDVVWLWGVLRVGLSLVAALLFVGGGLPSPCNQDLLINRWITLPQLDNQGIAFPLVGVWQHWDACWYSKIAYNGYEAGVPSTTFFPLLPLLMSVGSHVVGDDVNLTALVINGIAFIVALFGLGQLVRTDFDERTADRAVLYQAVFPVAFFFFAPFTESLFLACCIWALLAARRQNWLLVAVAGLLAGLARPTGLVLTAHGMGGRDGPPGTVADDRADRLAGYWAVCRGRRTHCRIRRLCRRHHRGR